MYAGGNGPGTGFDLSGCDLYEVRRDTAAASSVKETSTVETACLLHLFYSLIRHLDLNPNL